MVFSQLANIRHSHFIDMRRRYKKIQIVQAIIAGDKRLGLGSVLRMTV